MKALVLKAHGGIENFTVADIPAPNAAPGRVLVRIAAASLNPIDNKIRGGLPIGPDLPGVLGCDFAGTVEALGEGVAGFAPGDQVFGLAGGVKGHGGTLAEHIAADYRLIARKPANLSMHEAAALPLAAITAWETIDRVELKAGEQVLIHGGSGGVGHLAVQLAREIGARVAATVADADGAEIARSFGAEDIVLYREEKPADYVQRLTGGKGFPAIIDTVGGPNLANSFEAAGLSGRIATTAARATLDLSPVHAKALTFGVVFTLIPMLYGIGPERHGRILAEIARLAEAGKVRPLIDERRFGLADAPAAYALLEQGQARGKIVIDIA